MAQMNIVRWPQLTGEKCSRCGAVLNEGAAFCSGCGRPLRAADNEAPREESTPQGPEKLAEPERPAEPTARLLFIAAVALITALVLLLARLLFAR